MSGVFDGGGEDSGLVIAAALGFDLQRERETPLYKFLMLKAREAAEAAVLEFGRTALDDTAKLAELQASIRRYTEMKEWIDLAIEAGRAAGVQLGERAAAIFETE